MILIIDNYDSFSYNLYQYVGMLNKDVRVIKDDDMTVKEIEKLNLTHLIISSERKESNFSGVCEETVKYFKDKIPVLGISLGHCLICEMFGAEVVYAAKLMYGKTSDIHIANGSPVFRELPPVIQAGLYSSLIVNRATIPDELLVIAEDEKSQIMGVKHQDYDIYGFQFRPESILTKNGITIIENFLNL